MTPLDPIWLSALAVALLILWWLHRQTTRPYLRVNPEFADRFQEWALTTPDSYLALAGPIVSGHPTRNVAKVSLGSGPGTIDGFLKREHIVRWKDRLQNALAGFGFASKSEREAQMLEALRKHSMPCPVWLAVGQTRNGKAFLLTEKVRQSVPLNSVLQEPDQTISERNRLARSIGQALAIMHGAGFAQPDLYGKHILVKPATHDICILDWQRSNKRKVLPWRNRKRELATLLASVQEHFLSEREMRSFLIAYFRQTRNQLSRSNLNLPTTDRAAKEIRQAAKKLSKKRTIQQARSASDLGKSQQITWLNGEALCVTEEFLKEYNGTIPPDLCPPFGPNSTAQNQNDIHFNWDNGRSVRLQKNIDRRVLFWLVDRTIAKKKLPDEVRQAGILQRLARQGLATPTLLAFGHCQTEFAQIHSFLLTEPLQGVLPLSDWLASLAQIKSAEECELARRWAIQQAGKFLSVVHQAGCRFSRIPIDGIDFLVVPPLSKESPPKTHVALGCADAVVVQRGSRSTRRDIAQMLQALAGIARSRTDAVRFVLAYAGNEKLDGSLKSLLSRLKTPSIPQPAPRKKLEQETATASSSDSLALWPRRLSA